MLAVVFPGQGAQEIGMAMEFVRAFPEARAVFEEVDQATGLPLSRWIERGPAEVLQRTEIAQPAILAASLAIYRVLEPRIEGRIAYLVAMIEPPVDPDDVNLLFKITGMGDGTTVFKIHWKGPNRQDTCQVKVTVGK